MSLLRFLKWGPVGSKLERQGHGDEHRDRQVAGHSCPVTPLYPNLLMLQENHPLGVQPIAQGPS